jgi:hypothetical protein
MACAATTRLGWHCDEWGGERLPGSNDKARYTFGIGGVVGSHGKGFDDLR